MKRVVRAASVADEELLKYAESICKKAKELSDLLNRAPGHVLDKCQLYELSERLDEDIPAIEMTINTMKGPQKPKYKDMW